MTQEISLTPVNTLHRYYLNANRMRMHFDEILTNKNPEPKHFNIETRLYMEIWYGLLYVVIEGWERLELHDSEIDKLLASHKNHLLKVARNAVFHYQKKYTDNKLTNFCNEEGSVEWIRKLNEEFGRWFLNYLRKNKE